MSKYISSFLITMTIILSACSSSLTGSETPTSEPSENPIKAPVAFLAHEINQPVDEISLISSEKVEWNNSCLGASEPGEVCAEVITPGYRIVLDTPKGLYEIHTDLSGKSFRIVPTGKATADNLAVVWERSGGIAGICQRLTITINQSYSIEDCRNHQLISGGNLNQDQWSQIQKWLERFISFNWHSNPPQGSADMFTDGLTFNGKGSTTPSQNDEENIAQYLSDLSTELTKSSSFTTSTETSGVAGQVLIGPTCPGPQSAGTGETLCADMPYQATIQVLNQRNQTVTTIQTDTEGRFQVSLDPGTYTLRPQSSTNAPYPRAAAQLVTVEQGKITEIQIYFDSGIR